MDPSTASSPACRGRHHKNRRALCRLPVPETGEKAPLLDVSHRSRSRGLRSRGVSRRQWLAFRRDVAAFSGTLQLLATLEWGHGEGRAARDPRLMIRHPAELRSQVAAGQYGIIFRQRPRCGGTCGAWAKRRGAPRSSVTTGMPVISARSLDVRLGWLTWDFADINVWRLDTPPWLPATVLSSTTNYSTRSGARGTRSPAHRSGPIARRNEIWIAIPTALARGP